MKRILALLLIAAIALLGFTACGAKDDKKIVIGASSVPHAEILEVVKEMLAEEGYTLEIKEFDDYIQPNLTLESGDLDANYFQHQNYLDNFNEEHKTNLVTVASIHYEPYGLYPGKTKSLDDLKDGASIAVPNDPTNEARALLLLEKAGLIKVDPKAGLVATKTDIIENPKNLDIVEIAAAQTPRTLQDVDYAVINGNYALVAGLNVNKDALIVEEEDSLAGTEYVNVLVVKKGDEDREDIQALVKALQSDKVKQFIEGKYEGSVVPMF